MQDNYRLRGDADRRSEVNRSKQIAVKSTVQKGSNALPDRLYVGRLTLSLAGYTVRGVSPLYHVGTRKVTSDKFSEKLSLRSYSVITY